MSFFPGTTDFLTALLANSSLYTDIPLALLKTGGITTTNPLQGVGLTKAELRLKNKCEGSREQNLRGAAEANGVV